VALTDNLTNHWKLNEASGNRAPSHGSMTLTDQNTVGSTTGKLETAAHFVSGSSEYLSRSNHADLQTGNIDLTVAGWTRWDSLSGTRALVSKGNLAIAAEFEYVVESVGAELRTYVADGSSEGVIACTSVTLATGTWYFWVFWHDATNNQLGLQVNNGTSHTTSWTTGLYVSGFEFTLGRHSASSSGYFSGDLESVSIWKNKVLSSSERSELWNGGNGLAYPFTGGGGGVVLPQRTYTYRRRRVA
jgi:hypothetical protein